ncbi:MAG: hypothetical protein IID40_02845, partial [Planctomycetes bacterium]|nr:hypothetical protein [Planctomycetota bacterium]
AVITGRTDPTLGQPDIPYQALAEIDTVVILMGRSNLDEITKGLIAAGRSPGTPTACIEMGCTPQQRQVIGTLDIIAQLAAHQGLRAPAVTIVGAVVTLGHDREAIASSSSEPAETQEAMKPIGQLRSTD